jgi:hypothetical protein
MVSPIKLGAFMTKTALLISAAALAISAGSAFAAQSPVLTSRGFDVHATRLTIPNAGLATLYAQNDHDGGVAVVSQMFQSSFPTYNPQGADDFVVPSGSVWKVKEVDVTGAYFNGVGPAASENVYFYREGKDQLPGKQIRAIMSVVGADNGGSFVIKIPTVRLKAGAYWVSVQANCNFNSCGEWGWEVRSLQSNNLAAWRDPSPGGLGCGQTWQTMESCLNEGPDLMFALKGSK